ncbi:hypothetical protein [Streptomyces acidicola]
MSTTGSAIWSTSTSRSSDVSPRAAAGACTAWAPRPHTVAEELAEHLQE